MHTAAKRKLIRATLCCLALPFAGCQQHSHIATTQVVVHIGPNQTAVAEVAAPEPTPEPSTVATTQESTVTTTGNGSGTMGVGMGGGASQASRTAGHDVAQASRTAGHDVAQTSRVAGHDVAQASRSAGHDVAQASRDTYHATADGVRNVASSTLDITTRGAQRIRNSPPESLSAPEIDIDPAMQVRDWDQVSATYAAGRTIAGPIGFRYQPAPDQPTWHYTFIDAPLFFINQVFMPYVFFKTPPWTPIEWKSVTVEPTYTAVAPLPPE